MSLQTARPMAATRPRAASCWRNTIIRDYTASRTIRARRLRRRCGSWPTLN